MKRRSASAAHAGLVIRILISGTAPIGDDGTAVCVNDPTGQTRRCFEIIERALKSLGGGLGDVVRTRIYLTRVEDWEAVGAVYGEVFGALDDARPPVATMVAVAGLIDPDWRVEVEAEAMCR